MVREKLVYYPTVTREQFLHQGRITDLMASGQMFNDAGMPPLSREEDRVMICGSPAMLAELRQLLLGRGWQECEIKDRWLALTSMVLAPIRLAIKR
jgi:ferredoxin--NADP+ reductase